MTDIGCGRLAAALKTCRNLRYVYLYTTGELPRECALASATAGGAPPHQLLLRRVAGFKAAQKVTDDAKRHLKEQLPLHATAAFDHRLSRYLKKP